MLTTDTKPLLVHLSPAEKRRIKVMAASQDLTLRQAIREAFDAWSAQIQSRARTPEQRGEPATGAALQKPAQPRSAATPGEDRRQANEKSPATPGGSGLPEVGAASRAWLRHAAQLDWSKCPAVASAQGERGKILVVRGSAASLGHVLQSIADGHPLLEIAEVFELSLQQLVAVLQFSAEAAAPAGPAK